jgi:hypothetical protein
MSQTDETGNRAPKDSATQSHSRGWLVLLVLPYLGLCFPGLYARATPELLGFPFFYWYQFGWVMVTSCLLGVVYFKLRRGK